MVYQDDEQSVAVEAPASEDSSTEETSEEVKEETPSGDGG